MLIDRWFPDQHLEVSGGVNYFFDDEYLRDTRVLNDFHLSIEPTSNILSLRYE